MLSQAGDSAGAGGLLRSCPRVASPEPTGFPKPPRRSEMRPKAQGPALSPSRPCVWLSDGPVTGGLWELRGVRGRAGAEIQVCGLQTLLFPRNVASSLLRLDFLCSVLLGTSFLPLPSVPAHVLLLLQLIPDAHVLSVLPAPPISVTGASLPTCKLPGSMSSFSPPPQQSLWEPCLPSASAPAAPTS